jgi:LmbE family N-acetylglucosaminyl deacetylase
MSDNEVKRDCLLVSPHPDDVALALGSVLGGAFPSERCVLVTVFSNTNWLGPASPRRQRFRASKIRADEDRAFATSLGMPLVTLDFRDFPLRARQSASVSMHGIPHGELVSAVTSALKTTFKSEIVIAPQSVGDHVDHVVCRRAAEAFAISQQCRLVLYEDMPYGLTAKSTEYRAHFKFLEGAADRWFEAVSHYRSQRSIVETCVQNANGSAPLAGCWVSSLI